MAELDIEKLSALVFTALGEASMCWEHVDRAGIFQSERASEIGKRLMAALLEDRDRLRTELEQCSEAYASLSRAHFGPSAPVPHG